MQSAEEGRRDKKYPGEDGGIEQNLARIGGSHVRFLFALFLVMVVLSIAPKPASAGAATMVVCTPNLFGGLTCIATDPGGIASVQVNSVTAPPVVEVMTRFQVCMNPVTFNIPDVAHNHLVFIEEWADRHMGATRVFLVDPTGAVVPFPR